MSIYSALAISDIHYNKGNSRAAAPFYGLKGAWLNGFAERAAKFDYTFLNGDFFDFEAMMLKSFKQKKLSIEEISREAYDEEHIVQAEIAKQVLRKLLEKCPDTSFIFNMGNQDCAYCFSEKLDELEQEFPGRLHWSPHYTLLGKKDLITHGDIEMRGYSNDDRNERRYENFRQIYPKWNKFSIVKDTLSGCGSSLRFTEDKRYRDIRPMAKFLSEKNGFSNIVNIIYGHRHHKPKIDIPYLGKKFHQLGAFYLQNDPRTIVMELNGTGEKPKFEKTKDGSLVCNELEIIDNSITLATMMPYLRNRESSAFQR